MDVPLTLTDEMFVRGQQFSIYAIPFSTRQAMSSKCAEHGARRRTLVRRQCVAPSWANRAFHPCESDCICSKSDLL